MSKGYGKNNNDNYSMDFDRYLMDCEEGQYIAKRLRTKDVENVYIYSTLADVVVLPSREENIAVILQGVFNDEIQYFEVFRLDANTVYVFATCDAQSIVHSSSKLFVLLPETTTYNIQIVTNCGEAVVEEAVLVRKLKIDVEKSIVPESRKS